MVIHDDDFEGNPHDLGNLHMVPKILMFSCLSRFLGIVPMVSPCLFISGWFGGLEHDFFFSILGISSNFIPTVTHQP